LYMDARGGRGREEAEAPSCRWREPETGGEARGRKSKSLFAPQG
jgi:hypothetical protein